MCWLCEENVTQTINFIGDNSIRLGKDKNNKVAVLSKYRCHESIALYHPNFCPECGRDLRKETEMEIITYGICDDTFYLIEKLGDNYSLWWIDDIPTDMTGKGIENFMAENCTDGCFVYGDFNLIMNELAKLITDLT